MGKEIFIYAFLFLLMPFTFIGQPDTIMVYDIAQHQVNTILPITYNASAPFSKTSSNIGTLGNQVVLSTTPPTTNLFSGVNFCDLSKAADVFDLTAYPARTAVALRYYRGDSIETSCSGIIVSPNFVLSAGHCVYSYFNQSFSLFDSLKIAPVYNNASEQAGIPTSFAKRIYIFKTFYDKKGWDDIALIELSEPLGFQAGWVGMAYDTNPNNYLNKVFHKFSYPATTSSASPFRVYNGDTLYYNYGTISSAASYLDINSPQAVGIPGQSGSSFLYTDNSDYYSVGVMSFSSNYRHYKITNAVFYQLENVLANHTTGIYKAGASSSLKVYPNPSKDVLFVELNKGEEPVVTIYNPLGQAVSAGNNLEKDKLVINISSLESGVYYLHLKNTKAFYVKKFIKE